MKKETFNLVLRALIGVATSLIIVGAMGLITEAQGDKTFVEQASGLKGTEAVMNATQPIGLHPPGSLKLCLRKQVRTRCC